LTIMLIHYLQRVEPPVLPNLQCAETFKLEDEFLDEHKVQFAQPTEDFRLEFSKNKTTMGELYVGFFEYFGGQFDFHDEVVQIRSKDKLYKMDKDWTRSEICIEDPFDLTHNLTSGIRTSSKLIFITWITHLLH
jgi:terminal uridylyltransferase